ncbi:TM2 domain-containing protein [Eubacteriales bacterium OttesenSCG-928-M02]|nr:TM2 domain-containing protein [Eubacteriales bacterium OttesenSCG-928-M02]
MQYDNRVDLFLTTNAKYFPEDRILYLREKLTTMPEDRFLVLSAISFRDPTMMLILSIFFGELGVDRFLLGDVGMGILKLLTGGVCGILWLIDIFGITKKTKEYNFQKIMPYL